MKIDKCLNCGSGELERFMDLGDQPNGNVFPAENEFETEKCYPFSLTVCRDCWQVQLEEFPDTDSMFTDHPYVTGVNVPVVQHFNELAYKTIDKFDIPKNSLVIDIGANDGTLLSQFRDAGMRVLGVDPCGRTQKLAQQQGITVCETFWDRKSAEALHDLGIKPRLITATAVFYHVESIRSFVEGLSILMAEDTIFCTQCVYLRDVIEQNQFDHFYHEHTMIHAVAPLQGLFARYGLRMLDVERHPIHGGSFILYVGRDESQYETTHRIEETIAEERSIRLDHVETYLDFSKRVEDGKQELVDLLIAIKKSGKRVYGLGAPLKGSTLLNYYGIGPELIEAVTEVNEFKVGRYTPGTHIPIIHEDSVTQQPDFYLILAWNFLDFFKIKYAAFLEAGGKFIVPHPSVRVISASGESNPSEL